MNSNISTLIVLALAFSFVSVPLGTVVAFVMAFTYQGIYTSEKCRYALYLMMALAISYINLTKPVQISDLGYYYWVYNFAGEKSFIEYMLIAPKEPIYHLYNYVMRILTFGNFNLFLIVNTTICYMLIFSAYDIVVRHTSVDARRALIAAALLLLFSEFFFYTAQIVRQVLAGAVAIYGIAKNTFERNRYSIWIVVLAGFIHASAFLFMLYYVVHFLRNMKFGKLLALVLCFLVLYKVVLGFLDNVFADTSTIGVAINRGISGSGEHVSVGMLPLLICGTVLPMSFYVFWKSESLDEKLFFVFPAALIIFILMNIGSPLFVLRFMEYTYMFIPIALVLTVSHLAKYTPFTLFVIVLACMTIRFAVKLGSSDFSYVPFFDYLGVGIPQYVMKVFNL